MKTYATYTEDQLTANPSLIDGWQFVSQCSDANTRTFVKELPDPELPPPPPAPKKAKKEK